MYLVQRLWSSSEQTRIDDIFREKKEKKGNQLVPVSELIKCIKKESIARQYLELGNSHQNTTRVKIRSFL